MEKLQKVDLDVKGMHCKSCETLIKDSLEELDGIEMVTASEKKGRVRVVFDSEKLGIERIKAAIQQEGYTTV